MKDLGNTGGKHIGNRRKAKRRTLSLSYGLDSKMGEYDHVDLHGVHALLGQGLRAQILKLNNLHFPF